VPRTWLLNMGPGGYDNSASNFHQHSGVAQMIVLLGMMSRPNMSMSMIYRILESHEEHEKRLTDNGETFQSDELSS